MDKTDVLMELSAAGRDDLCKWANENLIAAADAESIPDAEFCPHCSPCRNSERLAKADRMNIEYDAVLRNLASYLGAGGFDSLLLIDPKTADEKIRWGIDHVASVERNRAADAEAVPVASFQSRVAPWMDACFGPEISSDKIERNHRFLEESLELVQSTGCTQSEAHQLVDYVFSRPVGDTPQEVGGVMVTLAALCLAQQIDMHMAGDKELARIWTKVEQIREKQAAKPKHSPLPTIVPSTPDVGVLVSRERVLQVIGWSRTDYNSALIDAILSDVRKATGG